MKGKIFLTGGTGSLGVAFLERAERENWDCRFTVYSRDEVKQGELKGRFPRHKYVLGDIRDGQWLSVVMKGHDIVIHTAAYKQVPAAEVNSNQAISVNVFGSLNVAHAAVQNDIPLVVGVSTDKACAPVNCYGATKMLMEKLFQEAGSWGKTQFNIVRYGNVLGSRGSVVPLFKKQMSTKILTLTEYEMTRFWMTLEDAVNLILASLDQPPSTVLVDKCKAAPMHRLMKAICPECDFKIIGIRPGEKIHEKLLHSGESMHTQDIGNYFRVYPAWTNYEGNLDFGYEYNSKYATQLSVEELRDMINESPNIRS